MDSPVKPGNDMSLRDNVKLASPKGDGFQTSTIMTLKSLPEEDGFSPILQ
jgi:hypothetical protein